MSAIWRCVRGNERQGVLEATTGIEPVMEVLQTSALPLGYVAPDAAPPGLRPVPGPESRGLGALREGTNGAEDEARTRDPVLGKDVLYH